MNESSPDGGTSTVPQSYTGRQVLLRPIGQQDYALLLGWRTELKDLHMWSSSRRVPTLEEFSNEMDTMLRQCITMLVTNRETNEPIGFVQAYNISREEGWCFFLAYFAPEYRQQRNGAEAAIAFFDYLFRNFNMRKIYMDVQEFNRDFLAAGIELGGFVEEGRFRQHTWYDGRYWDVIRVALYRDTWEELRELAMRVLVVGEDVADVFAEREKVSQP